MLLSISPAAESLFHFGSFPVTNSLINAWLGMLVLVGAAVAVRVKIREVPQGIQNFFEGTIAFFLKYIDAVTHDRKKSEKFLPMVGTIFLFILVSNWLGQLPGTGTIGFREFHQGTVTMVPFLRPATSDLNTTLAIALFSIVATHVFGVLTVGFFKYWNKFIPLADIGMALKGLKPIPIFVALMKFVVGVIELFSEAAKTVSLSLRLFGNIFAGEVLLAVLASLIAFLVPLPFLLLELLVGFIQATIFAMLILVFLEVATSDVH